MTRDEAREWLVEFLLEKVREDRYPSTTLLDLIEKVIPRRMLREYLYVLIDKVEHDEYPSIPLLRRIHRLIRRLPDHDGRHDREDEAQAGGGSAERAEQPAW